MSPYIDPDHLNGQQHNFELYSVLVHSGHVTAGHYFCCLKAFTDDKWYRFNDAMVEEIPLQYIESTFGGNGDTSAYMLVYRKCTPELETPVCLTLPDSLRDFVDARNAELAATRTTESVTASDTTDVQMTMDLDSTSPDEQGIPTGEQIGIDSFCNQRPMMQLDVYIMYDTHPPVRLAYPKDGDQTLETLVTDTYKKKERPFPSPDCIRVRLLRGEKLKPWWIIPLSNATKPLHEILEPNQFIHHILIETKRNATDLWPLPKFEHGWIELTAYALDPQKESIVFTSLGSLILDPTQTLGHVRRDLANRYNTQAATLRLIYVRGFGKQELTNDERTLNELEIQDLGNLIMEITPSSEPSRALEYIQIQEEEARKANTPPELGIKIKVKRKPSPVAEAPSK